MKHRDESPVVSRYRKIMKFFALLYLGGAILFFTLPDLVLSMINLGPQLFSLAQPIPLPTERFWLVLAVSMMAMLSALSAMTAKAPYTHGYPLVHLISKCVSTVGFLVLFFSHQRYFAYLVGVATDFPIALLVGWQLHTLRKEVQTRL